MHGRVLSRSCSARSNKIALHESSAGDAHADVPSLQPGGKAWASIVHVRLMHARVRVTLLKRGIPDRHHGAYDPGTVRDPTLYDRQRDGVAINQVCTLLVLW